MKGIIIAALERYEHILLYNIQHLRNILNCHLPIEIWQIGQEISDEAKKLFESKQEIWNITFKNVEDYTDNPQHWKGYQIKAFITKHTEFDEVILCDCDNYFLRNPALLFDDPNYLKTGTFFFKDYLRHVPSGNDEVNRRIKWFREMMPTPSPHLPKECYYLYDLPLDTQQYWFYQESGVVYINKSMHPAVIDTIYKMNANHEETYQYVHGDKETFWIACLLNNIPFYMNHLPGINLEPDIRKPMVYDPAQYGPALVHLQTIDEAIVYLYAQKGFPDIEKVSEEIIMAQIKGGECV